MASDPTSIATRAPVARVRTFESALGGRAAGVDNVRAAHHKHRYRWAQRIAANRAGGIGLLIVLVFVAFAVAGPWLMPTDPYSAVPSQRLRPPEGLAGIGGGYVLGTDQLGRDILTRILYGARVSLSVGFTAVAISVPLGVLLGMLGGYFGGRVDDVLGRITDAQLAIPFILLAIGIIGVIGASPQNVVLVLGIGGWPIYARVTRSLVLVLKCTEYVEACRAAGGSHVRVLLRHILPNALTPTVVIATFGVAQMITQEAALGFLGLGIQPPVPTWGQMLSDGKSYLMQAWWLSTFPGLAIAILVLAINFLGDGLRDAMDPRLQT